MNVGAELLQLLMCALRFVGMGVCLLILRVIEMMAMLSVEMDVIVIVRWSLGGDVVEGQVLLLMFVELFVEMAD